MQIRRGTTPKIVINVKSDIDLSAIKTLWISIFQDRSIKIDRELTDVTLDLVNHSIIMRLSQEDTFLLKAGDAKLQIRLLLENNDALASAEVNFKVTDVLKDGVIT